MKCVEFENVVHDLARRELDPAIETIARAHAEACPSCACRLAEAEGLARILRTASAEARQHEAPPELEALLLGALRRESAERRAITPARKGLGWRFVLGWAGAAAAVALVAFAVLSHVQDHRSVPPAARTQTVASSADVAAVSPAEPAKQAATAARSTQASLNSGFVPVPYTGGFGPGESGVIVRVQVPRSSLAELGYPVGEAQGNGVVQADLVIGEDGWPRAVRIVR